MSARRRIPSAVSATAHRDRLSVEGMAGDARQAAGLAQPAVARALGVSEPALPSSSWARAVDAH